MGFCLFNNVAVTAGSIAAQGERVMVLDWMPITATGPKTSSTSVLTCFTFRSISSPSTPGPGR